MANKSLVSEPIHRPAPFVPGEYYIEADVHQMPEALRYFPEHPAEREQIVDRAYRFVTEQLTFEWSVSLLVALVHERLVAWHQQPGRRQT